LRSILRSVSKTTRRNLMSVGRLAKFTIPAGRKSEALRSIKELLIPSMEAAPGFLGGYWLLDESTGEGTAVTIWDSPETRAAFGTAVKEPMEGTGAITGISIQDLPLVASSRGADVSRS